MNWTTESDAFEQIMHEVLAENYTEKQVRDQAALQNRTRASTGQELIPDAMIDAAVSYVSICRDGE